MNIKKIVVICVLLICICFDIFFPNSIILKKEKEIPNINNIDELIIREKQEKKQLEDFVFHISLKTLDDGEEIYTPSGYGYRYGPSIIQYEDGSLDTYYAAPGINGAWDQIAYRHYDSASNSWDSEQMVLKPNASGEDHYSACDPGVIYFDGYYYIGYTSTQNYDGIENNIYVARSNNPDGPFEKWNGESWGGNPKPLIQYDGEDNYWGAGEISFVVMDDKIYCYYSHVSEDGEVTRLSIADRCEDWPLTLQYQGISYRKRNCQDSCDVVYIDDIKKFMAVSIMYRLGMPSGVAVFESDDGITFEQSDLVFEGIHDYAHNIGISKNPYGHIKFDDDLFIGYAYSKINGISWGKWATKFQDIDLYLYEGERRF